jgi:transcriptional regulator with XRE-family HTH domain
MSSDQGRLFRERLRSLRDAKSLSQSQLEERIGKEANYISRVETGRIDTPPLDVIGAIAVALDVSVSDLFFHEGLDDDPESLRCKIQELIATEDRLLLRKYYRMLLLLHEK